MRGVEHKTDNLSEDLKNFKVDAAQIELLVGNEIDSVEIDTDNEVIVLSFLKLQTQWRKEWIQSLGVHVFTGLNYSGVESYLRMNAVEDVARVFGGIQTMETAAISEFLNVDN